MKDVENLTTITKVFGLSVEHIITLIGKYFYDKEEDRGCRKKFGQCRNLWIEINGTKLDMLRFLHYPQCHQELKKKNPH